MAIASTFSLRRPAAQCRLNLTPPPPMEEPFDVRYRPRTLAEMTGHLSLVKRLQRFARQPYSRGLIFAGDTGAGKSTGAFALAQDLGALDMAGLHVIRSASQDVETVRTVLNDCRYTPFPIPGSSGWHVVIVEEADHASKAAAYVWLSALESLPPRTVVIFTTNRPQVFEQRFVDRCDYFDFPTTGPDALDAAQILSDHIWYAETGKEDGPDVQALPNVVIDGRVSYRRVCSALESIIRYGA